MTSFYFGSRVAGSAHAAAKSGTDGTSTTNAQKLAPAAPSGDTTGTPAQDDLNPDGTSTANEPDPTPTAVAQQAAAAGE